ncbi:tripartite tricarboxylate transporter TctB family protein [Saccharopolyspora sp. K220]|uniref:tripartite tricarboxylate transporter TctB family protein n=1 Tax=Saccharopolyspora soli TaxID=2926618 RepID=UPI001F585902|nr:tripartite tricarboxylate transporter TctB family protein [Saccharopolyspora soli]MCI2418177.1 tripartite tricarboxylate transporter TctB family protein [Saccharopolyspora soli]
MATREPGRRPGFAHRIGGVVALLVGVFFTVQAAMLPLGDFARPGPGLWPLLVGLVMIGASILVLCTDSGADHEPFTASARYVAFGVAGLAVFVTAFNYLGFILPALVTFTCWLRLLARESWRTALLLGVVLTALFYVLFVPVLGVPFPQDVVASLWGGD